MFGSSSDTPRIRGRCSASFAASRRLWILETQRAVFLAGKYRLCRFLVERPAHRSTREHGLQQPRLHSSCWIGLLSRLTKLLGREGRDRMLLLSNLYNNPLKNAPCNLVYSV